MTNSVWWTYGRITLICELGKEGNQTTNSIYICFRLNLREKKKKSVLQRRSTLCIILIAHLLVNKEYTK